MDRKAALRSILRQSGYLLLGFPLGLVFFLLTVLGLSLGAAAVIVWVGVPMMAGTLAAIAGCAEIERRMASSLVGRTIPTANYRPREPGFQGWMTMLSDPQRWFDALWVLAYFACSTITFTLTTALWAGAAWVFVGPPTELILHLLGLQETAFNAPIWLVNAVEYLLALVCLVVLPRAVPALAGMQTALSQLLLGTRASYEAKVDHLERSRQAARSAEAQSLHRLERDIHDGPQQRLIRLQMDLARAERAAESDPQRAQELLSQAREQTSLTLAELRNLSRGIAPPILQDRGLVAALDELAARSEIPCTVSVRGICADHQRDADSCPNCGGRQPAEHLLTTAYFVAAEALTNANKHSAARGIELLVAADEQMLGVTIIDDGQGGASLAKGHGLAGLEQRLASVDGTLHVGSPAGGPTIVQAVMPCGS